MKIFKWVTIFVIAFLFAWILIFTFTQEQFKQVAQARILAYWTPAIPIYFYVAGAFGIGLVLGLLAALYYYILFQTKMRRATRENRDLEEKLAMTHRELEQYRPPDEAAEYGVPENSSSQSSADVFPEKEVDSEASGQPL